MKGELRKFVLPLILLLFTSMMFAADSPRKFPLTLKADDVIPTGNEWIALPTIRASDGAISSFNVLSMRDRGLLEVVGDRGTPALQPYVTFNGKPVTLQQPEWEVIEYWIPTARFKSGELEITITYCAPPESRAAFIRMTATNSGSSVVQVVLGMKASWGALHRVTYTPVTMRGDRTTNESPWVSPGQVFSFVTSDTHFSWSLVYPGAEGKITLPPLSVSPELDAKRTVSAAPGETVEVSFVLAPGIEEFSAAHNARALRELIDRNGAEAIIQQAAAWCRGRTRTTGQADLDLLMNRNFLFSMFYAWGKTIDTEQFVGVTSRSPRYYVSAAYWDRDAMLWSFPGLLDVDRALARSALEYALTIQLRNSGTHSRFIDGIVLEDGFQLDEAVAPIIALAEYVRRTGNNNFLAAHRDAVVLLRDRQLSRFDSTTGLYTTLQDSQDEYQKQPFNTYDNVLTWKALQELSGLFQRMNDKASAQDMKLRAEALRKAILQKSVATPEGGSEPIFVSATDGKEHTFADVPPGSLFKLPALGFLSEKDPLFTRTYEWLHSPNYKYSYSDKSYGLPGSYRLPFTTSWSVADHLNLGQGREQALKILKASGWDGGIISEGVDPETGVMDLAGRAFATAAGYVAHAICENYCTDKRQ